MSIVSDAFKKSYCRKGVHWSASARISSVKTPSPAVYLFSGAGEERPFDFLAMTARDIGWRKKAALQRAVRVVAGSELSGQAVGGIRGPVATGGRGCVASPSCADVAASERA